MSASFLRQVALFADLPAEDLDRLCSLVQGVTLASGETLFEEGSPGDRAYVIERGELEVVKQAGEREVLLAVRRTGEVIGEMSLLEEAPRMAGVRARTDARLLAIEQQVLVELINTSATAARAMFYNVLHRWRSTGATLRQSEKMAQLGTLTAGVAHELNNPAAAVKRSADQLRDALGDQARADAQVAALGLAEPQMALLAGLRADAERLAAKPPELDALARADREEALETWLDDHGLPDPWDLAPALVDLELGEGRLAELHVAFGDGLAAVVQAMAATQTTHSLLAELSLGAERISSIVGALKRYSFLDQAPVQEVDVHEGLDNTLLILRHKLKTGISVRREYAADLPRIQAHGSALNQVWTNLIDNACDALDGQGTITIRTRREADWVVIEIEDDGPGIPEHIQGRVFDAFFTTKAPGKGTGQGLDIAWRMVVDEHRGALRLFSRPGATRFQIQLPIDPATATATPMANAELDEDDIVAEILQTHRRIAVVGISDQPTRPAHTVPRYLQEHGFTILPVSPRLDEVLGEPAYPDLAAVPQPVDTVLVFRGSEHVPGIVDEAIRIGAKAVWMQSGITHDGAAERGRDAGLLVVTDRCMRHEHRLSRSASAPSA